ncbi:Glu/Leu/Phe/Val family dehydrogenase [Luteibaculum oceani]|uniref:Glu/Leu/Phe/Val dehydrogenase n=1 Tax=Luteibaculum oceani TaxID=1294296 RepID=A0A5C6V994_9FLAO|nr:Glu/Leu/Phe/Val dehydrogenase [Luteibaculum oceani]TXC82013.1 Glu/Leu/Phe/Val dehydrogenase [Luteibaculum oceani]
MFEVEEINQNSLQDNPVLSQLSALNHEELLFCNDKATGLKAIIAVHNTVLGPALGGTRMWKYNNEMEAITDVLRLSRGMTYKSAISGLNLGGGKAVIIGDSRKDKSEAMFRRFGRFVNDLGGKYITAEDVGINTRDIEYIAMETDFVSGKPAHLGGGGDPSPVTAYGVYMGMKAAAKKAYGTDSLTGKTVLVQGCGNVGRYLIDYIAKENAVIKISDIHEDSIKMVTDKHSGVTVVPVNEVYNTEMDIYAPCALGATINDETLKVLKCQIVAGAANNQLADEAKHGKALIEKGMLYAPDFLINAGGIINCYSEVIGYNEKMAMEQTENIYNTTLDIFTKSELENIPTYLAANKMAEARIDAIAKVKRSF